MSIQATSYLPAAIVDGMNRNNLIPTVVVDKNNKTTTVHKRNGVTAPSASRLGSLKPTLKSGPKLPTSKVPFSTKKSGASFVHLMNSDRDFIFRAGLFDDATELLTQSGGEGSVVMTNEALYDYLRVGIEPAKAAILHSLDDGGLEAWMESEDFAKALPGDLTSIRVWGGSESPEEHTVSGIVDFFAEGGIKPAKIAAVLRNNLHDGMLEKNALSPEQMHDLFARSTYSVSTNEERGTRASRMMDGIIEGRLPFDLIGKDSGVGLPTAATIHDLLYPRTRAEEKLMSEDQRRELLENPDMLISAGRVMTKHGSRISHTLPKIHDAVKTFGEKACLENDPTTMIARHADGSYLGPEGAQRAGEVFKYISERFSASASPKPRIYSNGEHYTMMSPDMQKSIDITPEDMSDMVRLGMSHKEIMDATYKENRSSWTALALRSGSIAAPIVEGWL